jgi:hypothetical protein
VVPEARRHTLIASPTGPEQYEFDVIVQGEHETIFFDF